MRASRNNSQAQKHTCTALQKAFPWNSLPPQQSSAGKMTALPSAFFTLVQVQSLMLWCISLEEPGSQPKPWLQGNLGNVVVSFPVATEQGGTLEGAYNG